ncbi:MAG: hypothetical protein GC180_01925 [Bacteroidetes bacterium]|nr:hypothetical protein [Bacteroidota bacterium]
MSTSVVMLFFSLLSFLISGLYLFFYFSRVKKNKGLLIFALAKFFEGIGVGIMGSDEEHAGLKFIYVGFLILTGMFAEISAVISYDQVYRRKSQFFLTAVFLLGFTGLLFGLKEPNNYVAMIHGLSAGVLCLFGSIQLFKRKPRSSLLFLVASSYLLFSIAWLYSAYHASHHIGTLQLMTTQNSAHLFLTICTVLNLVVSTIGYLMLQKELDENRIMKDAEIIQEDNRKLNHLIQTKNLFFSLIAHDLRGPIGGLSQLGELLTQEDDLDQSERKEIIQAIANTSKNSFILLDNLLLWARSESGGLQMHPTELLLKELLEKSISILIGNLRQKQLEVRMHVPNQFMIRADAEMMGSIFRNLIHNAVKFSHPEGKIEINAHNLDSHFIQIEIRDYGTGMSSETLRNLFTTELKKSQPGTNHESGTGLGLLLIKSFIDMHGGSITADSKPNEGTSFFIQLPVEA